jgi:glycosidase
MLTQQDIIYFILVDRFCDGTDKNNMDVDKTNPTAFHGGDFEGIRQRIPYLKALGVTALWMTPVVRNTHMPEWGAWGYHGYWPEDFEQIDPHFHTSEPDLPEGSRIHLKRLVDELHRNGILVILDVVTNHVGYNHPLFADDTRYPIKKSWFNADDEWSEQKKSLMGLPDLNQDNVEVGDYFIGVLLDWIADTGVDCLRFDAVKHVESIFWQRVKTYIKGKHPNLTIIAEVLDTQIERTALYQTHFDFDSVFDFPLQHALVEALVQDKPMSEVLARPEICSSEKQGVLNGDFMYANHNRLITLLDNHDTEARFITLLLRKHEGNWEKALPEYLIGLTLLFCLRGIPQLYYGNEIGLEGGKDPDNRRDMPWDWMEGVAGEKGPSEDHPQARCIFRYVQSLIRLIRQHEALQCGASITLYANPTLFVYIREFRTSIVIIAVHNGKQNMSEPISVQVYANPHLSRRTCSLMEGRMLRDALSGEGSPLFVQQGAFSLQLPGKAAAIYVLDPA